MSSVFILTVALLVVAQLALPKHLGFIPLIVAGSVLGNMELLPQVTPARLLILVGLFRAVCGKFFVFPNRSKFDRLFILFALLALLSTIGHKPDAWVPSPFNARAGLVLNILGTYLYGRAYLPDLSSFLRFAFVLPIILIPLAFGMLVEKRTSRNPFYVLGARSEGTAFREDKVRARGPYRHPILAGTAGATALPLVFLLWHFGRRKQALIGLAACFTIVIACASSGPLAAVAAAFGGIILWYRRSWLKPLMWGGVAFAIFYVIYSGRGPWYLMAHMDLVGGSTGWHRARLIDSGYTHLGEWWLWGTDYTRNWMGNGVSWNPNMVDITNYYLHLGVIGGLPLMVTLVAILVSAFRALGRRMAELRLVDNPTEIVLWCTGVSLATHAISFISISYFDQMYIYFYMLLGSIPALVTSEPTTEPAAPANPTEISPTPVTSLGYYS